jgi:hypothetical protein
MHNNDQVAIDIMSAITEGSSSLTYKCVESVIKVQNHIVTIIEQIIKHE